MKEESPCAVNALRTALRIDDKRRIIDAGALKSNPQAANAQKKTNNNTSAPMPRSN